jgi:uncharacterized Tic20 family protein
MEQTTTETHKQIGALMHGSTFLKYFFPLGNFFAPLLLWTLHKEKPFLDHHGKQAINFQLSVFVYALAIALLSLPFVAIYASDFVGLIETLDNARHIRSYEVSNISSYVILIMVFAFLFLGLFLFELYYVITATINASKGIYFKYPLCIPFINTNETPSEILDTNISEEDISENPTI